MTTTIEFKCPSCGKAYRVRTELSGRKVRCKACEEVIVVPQSDELLLAMEEGSGFPKARIASSRTPSSNKPGQRNRIATPSVRWLGRSQLRGGLGVVVKAIGSTAFVVLLLFFMALVRGGGFAFSAAQAVMGGFLAGLAVLVLSMFDYVKTKRDDGQRVPVLLRLLFTRSLFHIAAWAVFLGVGIVLFLTFALGDLMIRPGPLR